MTRPPTTLAAADLCRHVSERDWQATVIEYARTMGWAVYHPWMSLHSASGWPDLSMVRDGRLVFAELKTETGRVSKSQRAWIALLSAVPGVEVFLWRPSAWPEVERVLGR